jgi:hypothetical protein
MASVVPQISVSQLPQPKRTANVPCLITLNYNEFSTPFGWDPRSGRNSKRSVHKLARGLSAICHADGLDWRYPRGLMNSAEIVVANIQRDGCNVIASLRNHW